MAQKGRREYDDDDGRTIVPMNVDGMPWYTGGFTPPHAPDESPETQEPKRPPISREERRGYVGAAVGAALLIAAIFGVVYGLFLLFCRFVWLK